MLKRWCGNVYSTSERNYQTLNEIKAKSSFGAMLEGKSMPSNMAANTNHTNFVVKPKYHKVSPLNAFPLKFRV